MKEQEIFLSIFTYTKGKNGLTEDYGECTFYTAKGIKKSIRGVKEHGSTEISFSIINFKTGYNENINHLLSLEEEEYFQLLTVWDNDIELDLLLSIVQTLKKYMLKKINYRHLPLRVKY